MQQIYRKTLIARCDFVYWNHTLTWVFSCKFAAFFQNAFLSEDLWVAASEAFLESQFRYCFLTWMFHSRKSNHEINLFHESALRMIYNDQFSSFQEVLDRDHSFTVHHFSVLVAYKLNVKGYFPVLVDATKMYLGFNRPNS